VHPTVGDMKLKDRQESQERATGAVVGETKKLEMMETKDLETNPAMQGGEKIDAVAANLLATAYHEAGHAVIEFLHGGRFKRVYIDPETCSGACEHYGAKIVAKILERTHCNIWLLSHPDEEKRIVERDILSTMAGHIAQEMGVPGSVAPWQWESDKDALIELLLCYDPENGGPTADATVRRELKENWYLVEGFAQKLMKENTITGKEGRRFLIGLQQKNSGRQGQEGIDRPVSCGQTDQA